MRQSAQPRTATWGHCEACDRWFPCPRWFDKEAPQPLCPRCLTEPSAIEHREVHSPAATPPGIVVGQCPRCRRWFDCEDWFDAAQPLPRCLDCGLIPTRIERLQP